MSKDGRDLATLLYLTLIGRHCILLLKNACQRLKNYFHPKNRSSFLTRLRESVRNVTEQSLNLIISNCANGAIVDKEGVVNKKVKGSTSFKRHR